MSNVGVMEVQRSYFALIIGEDDPPKWRNTEGEGVVQLRSL